MSTVNVITKFRINGVDYNLPSWGGGGGGADAATVNALVDAKLGNFDTLFNLTSWLYQVLNDLTDEDELGLTAGDTWADIVSNTTDFSLVTHSYTVFNMVANSDYALDVVMADDDAVDEVLECWNSCILIANNSKACEKFLSDSDIVAKIFASSVATDAFLNSDAFIKAIVENATLLQQISLNAQLLNAFIKNATFINAITENSTTNTTLQWLKTNLYNTVTGNSTYFTQITRTYADGVTSLNNSTKTANCIVFTACWYYSNTSQKTNVYHANGVLAHTGSENYRPTSVTANTTNCVSFTNCTFTETSDGYAAIAVYQAK